MAQQLYFFLAKHGGGGGGDEDSGGYGDGSGVEQVGGDYSVQLSGDLCMAFQF